MAFDIERARADGLSEEEIQAAIAYGKSLENIEEEIIAPEVTVTPEPTQPEPTQPVPTQPEPTQQPTTGFDVERARADGLSEEEIQAAIAYGKSLENIEQPTQQLTQLTQLLDLLFQNLQLI